MEIYCPLAAERGCLAPTLIAADLAALALLGAISDEEIAECLVINGRCRGCADDVAVEEDVNILPRDWQPRRT